MRGRCRHTVVIQNQAGTWYADNVESPSRGIGRTFERARDLVKDLGSGIIGARRRLAPDAGAARDTPEDIDMTVGAAVAPTAAESDDLARAECRAARRLALRL